MAVENIHTQEHESVTTKTPTMNIQEGDFDGISKVLEQKEGGGALPEHLMFMKQDLDGIKTKSRNYLRIELRSNDTNTSITEKDIEIIFDYLGDGCSNIDHLVFDSNTCKNLQKIPACVTKCKNLRFFNCYSTNISDVSVLSGLTNLSSIDIMDCSGIKILPNLSRLSTIKNINISGTNISDVSTLSGLGELETINFGGCKLISTLPDLSKSAKLKYIDISHTGIRILDNLPKSIKDLDINSTNIQDISQIYELPVLGRLNINNSKVDKIDLSRFSSSVIWGIYMLGLSKIKEVTVASFPKSLTIIEVESEKMIQNGRNSDEILWSTVREENTEYNRINNMDAEYGNESRYKNIFRKQSIKDFYGVCLTYKNCKTPAQKKFLFSEAQKNFSSEEYIRLLEESRKVNDNTAETQSEFSSLPSRESLLNGVEPSKLLDMLINGQQELLAGYESTFAILFNTYMSKDPTGKELLSRTGKDLWQGVSLIAQMSPRYLGLKGSKSTYIDQILTTIGTTCIDKMTSTEAFTIDNAIDSILPIINIYTSAGTSDKVKKALEPFLITFAKKISGYYVPDMKKQVYETQENKRTPLQKLWDWIIQKKVLPNAYIGGIFLKPEDEKKYQLAGLLLYQLANIQDTLAVDTTGNKVNFDKYDIEQYKLDTGHLTKIDLGWTTTPGVTHMFFDDNEDGLGSYDHFLSTIGLSISYTSVSKNGLTYTMEHIEKDDNESEEDGNKQKKNGDNSYNIIKVTKDGKLINTISFNHPANQSAIKRFEGKPDFVVDRGHAGHEKDGISAIGSHTKLVHIGSCGGFSNLSESLAQNSQIQFIGTTGTGHKVVNDAIFWSIMDQGCQGKPIDRIKRTPKKEFINTKDPLDKNGFDNRKNYQLPPKQLGGALKTKYEELIDNGEEE